MGSQESVHRSDGNYVEMDLGDDLKHVGSSSTMKPMNSVTIAGEVPLPDRPLRILILMSDTGGGHRASADALAYAFRSVWGPQYCEVIISDFWVELVGPPFFHKMPEQYAFMARHPALWKFSYLLTKSLPGRVVMDFCVDLLAYGKARASIERIAPDVIVSVHPLVQQLTMDVLQSVEDETHIPRVPFVTVVTDYGDAHPTWFHKEIDVCYVPSEPVRKVAASEGLMESQLRLFGLPLRSAFVEDKRSCMEVRELLGLDVSRRTILLVGGGDGVGGLSTVTIAVTQRLVEEGIESNSQLVVICGRNRSMAQTLRARNFRVPVHVLEFVNNMHEWMRASDVIVTKAGPGTIAEALVCGVPIILSSFLPGQEEGNVTFVVENNIGAYLTDPIAIADKVCEWLNDPEELGALSERARSFGRPNATTLIAADLLEETTVRLRLRNKQIKMLAAQKRSITEGFQDRNGSSLEDKLFTCFTNRESERPRVLLLSRIASLMRHASRALCFQDDSTDRYSRMRTE
mmetsp:Transcript_8764/g.15802  ORF Transcript_8764/g.15802 Transcript_8764/m.15802 type:complete len:517 (-) Transcript_8764:1486-3036(-)